MQLQNCFLSVDDHEKAIAFYRDGLGLEVTLDAIRDLQAALGVLHLE